MSYHPYLWNPRALADAIRQECKDMAELMDKDKAQGYDPEAHSCHVIRRAVRTVCGYEDDSSFVVEHYTKEYTELFQPVEDMNYLCWLECTAYESCDYVPKYRLGRMRRAYWRIDAVCLFAAMIEQGDVT